MGPNEHTGTLISDLMGRSIRTVAANQCPTGCGFKNGWTVFLLCSHPWHTQPQAEPDMERDRR